MASPPNYCQWAWALQLWLLCVLSSLQLSWTAMLWTKCSSVPAGRFKEIVADSVGPTGLMTNLTVLCEREVAQLYFNAGGNKVKSLRAAQECTILHTNETTYETLVSIATVKDHQQWNASNVAPLFREHLQDSDIECHYFGCYYIDIEHEEYYDVDYNDLVDRVIFPNATCTFSQLAIMSSIVRSNPSSSLLMASSIVSVSNHSISTVHSHPSSAIMSSITITPSNSSSSLLIASSIATDSISTVPSQSSNSSGNVESRSEWIILAALIIPVLVISIIIFISCLLFTSKRFFNSSIKQDIHYYDPNEPLDKKFTPVNIKLSLSPSLSGISTSTKLDQLHRNEETFDELENILNTPTESTEFSLITDTSTDPSESENKDGHNYEPNNNNIIQRRIQSESGYTYTPRIGNDIADNEHELEVFNFSLDTEYDNNSELTEPILDGCINITGQLSEASTPIDTYTPNTPHVNSEIQPKRLSNSYVSMTQYSGREESSSMTDDDLSCGLEPIIIPLDNLGPAEPKLEDMYTSGYVSNDQLQHMDVAAVSW